MNYARHDQTRAQKINLYQPYLSWHSICSPCFHDRPWKYGGLQRNARDVLPHRAVANLPTLCSDQVNSILDPA